MVILRLTNTKITNNIIVITSKSNTNNQYQTIRLRLHGCNSSCTIPKVIPNTAKLKVVTVVLINNLLNFLSYVYLQYKSINVYKDKNAINTPTQDNNQSPPPLTNINRNQHIPAAEKQRKGVCFSIPVSFYFHTLTKI